MTEALPVGSEVPAAAVEGAIVDGDDCSFEVEGSEVAVGGTASGADD